MSGIFASLNAASAALQMHGKGVELAGKNIANLNNPDYTRQRITTGSIGGGIADSSQIGTTVYSGVEQLRDVFIDRQILAELAHTSSLETEGFRLRQILGTLGESVDRVNDPAYIGDSAVESGSLRGQIDAFFNAFETLSARPSDASAKAVLFQSAESMVETFNRIDDRLAQVDQSLGEELVAETTSLNERLSELSELNREIFRFGFAGSQGGANDLLDRRQGVLEAISKYLNVETALVEGSGGQISVKVRDANGDPVTLLEPGSESLGIVYDAANNTFRSPASAVPLDLQAGRLASLARVRGEHLEETRARIDTLANSVATSVNELYYQAYVPAGANPAVPEVAFFQHPVPPPSISGTPSNVTAASIRLYLGSSDPLVAESIPLTSDTIRSTMGQLSGANELAAAIASLGTTDLPGLGGISLAQYSIRTSTGLGQEIRDIENRLDVQRNVEALLKDQRAQTSGVSLDEEVADLVQYQRAFQASSRVFNVLSEMLETIVTGLR